MNKMSSNMTPKEILNDFKENYGKVRKLMDEESRNDPENEPYLSKYKAKEILCKMCDSIKNIINTDSNINRLLLEGMLGVVLLNIGVINMETEELSASEKVFTEALDLLSQNSMQPEIITTTLNIYNNLGILWSHNEPDKAKNVLLLAKELYEKFKCTLKMPVSIEHAIKENDESATGEIMLLEKAHTLTLYYLAQVYGSLKQNLKSAVYCHVTLKRQLQYSDFEPIDWSLNSATLSQFFAEKNGFFQSRHHLAAATTVLDKYEAKLREEAENNDDAFLAKIETLKHRTADVARCWVKYCLLLLTASKARLMNDSDEANEILSDMSNLKLEDEESICGVDVKNLIFPELDVSKYENKISDKFLLTYEDAREVFLSCQSWLNKAKEYYRLDTLASDYIELIQDSSQSYYYLAFFEEDDERRAKMHKRRIDLLEDLLKEINPTYYMQYCRQLWYELGEIYLDIMNIKLEKLNKSKNKPAPHSVKKVNTLCEKSIEHFDSFLNSVKDKNDKLPLKLERDLIRPVISAYGLIGHNSMKRISGDKAEQLSFVNKSYSAYEAVVDICTADEEAAEIMWEEFSLCQQLVQILPLKIQKLEGQLAVNN